MTVNSLGQQESDSSSRTVAERLMPLLPIGLAMFTLSALLYYHLRHDALDVQSPLQLLVAWVYRSFGFAPSFLGFLLLLTWGSIWFVTGSCERPLSRLARLFAMVVMLGVFLNLGDGRVSPAFHKGELGAWLGQVMVGTFGYFPSLIVVWAITVAALLLATDFFFRDAFEKLREAGRAGSPPADAGVESEVTDHLKGLAGVALPPRSAASSGPVVPSVAPVAVVSDVVLAEGDADVLVGSDVDEEVEVQPEVDEIVTASDEPPRRVSYFERRRAAPPLEEEEGGWVPTAPESQDIDNAEIAVGPLETDLALAAALDAEMAAAAAELERAAEPAQGEEVVVVSADEDRVREDDEPEVAAGEELPVRGVPRSLAADWFAPAAAAPGGPAAAEGVEAEDEADAEEEAAEDDETEVDELEDLESEAAESEEVAAEVLDEDEDVDEDVDEIADEDEPAAILEPAVQEQEADDVAPEPVANEDEREPVVSIPRPATPPQVPARQQRLFGEQLDGALVAEATQLVIDSRRASAAMLQRKLRVDFDTALLLLAELARRGVVELDEDAAQGRLLR